MIRHLLPLIFGAMVLFPACAQDTRPRSTPASPSTVQKSDEQWKKELSSEEYRVLRQHGTERAFSGDLWNHHAKCTYTCAGCGQPLFGSDTKFDSGTGWPSFFRPINDTCIGYEEDVSYGMVRSEVHCSRCGGHLGHVFEDGPQPTGLRYCINSAALNVE